MNFQELKAIGLANPKGKLLASIYPNRLGPDKMIGNDVTNCGEWEGKHTTRDIIEDLWRASKRLASVPFNLIGNGPTIAPLYMLYYETKRPIHESLAPFFAKRPGDDSFIIFDDTADPGIVLLIGTGGDVVYIDTR